MESLREHVRSGSLKLFPWVWRLAILSLPWQTRWFQEGPKIAGYPWEEGRLSIYGSELMLLLTIFLAFFAFHGSADEERAEQKNKWRLLSVIVVISLLGLSFFTTSSLRSTFEWCIEVLILIGFFWTLMKHATWRSVSFWVCVSLLPHALLGIDQAIVQRVRGSSLLGMASQNPLTPGVAVIEVEGVRWLRSYGGFSHPNIFGGWLVMGVALAYETLKQQLLKQRERIFYYSCLVLFSVGLILTYSRSAWLGLGLFGAVSIGSMLFSKKEAHKKRHILALGLILVSCGGTILIRPQLIFARAQTATRLEQKSLSERAQGIQNAWRILRAQPLFGSGLGANVLVISELDAQEGRNAFIPVSPHIVPLLALAELGIVGSSLFLFLLFIGFKAQIRSIPVKKHLIWLAFIPLLILVPAFCLDHYLWSYWSGKTLFLLAISFLYRRDEPNPSSSI